MPSKENTGLIRKLFEIYNKNDSNNLKAFDEVLASNVQIHDPALPKGKSGIDVIKQVEKEYIKAFPNKKMSIEDIFAADDRVAVRWTASGIQKGEFHGNAPSNRECKTSGISLYHISNGKITEISQVWDLQGLLEQIGKKQFSHAH